MNKISKFISKYFNKIALILSLGGKEAVVLVIISLIGIYITKNPNILEKYTKKINDKKKNNIVAQKNEENKIKLVINKKNSKNKDPYNNNIQKIQSNYDGLNNDFNFSLNVNNSTCITPIFNLRTYSNIDFYFNFLIHEFDSKKINTLIMTKDIQKWMSTSSLNNEDLEDELLPIYFIKKTNGITDVFEYLKIFIHTETDGVRIAFVQKGNDYLSVQKEINILIEKDIIKDLLNGEKYFSYNLSIHDGVITFLEKFLSLVLISEQYVGEKILLDIENCHENKSTFEYHYNVIPSDCNMFNTTI